MGLRTLLGLKKKSFHNLNESYSQEGEDCLLYRLFEGQSSGFFVDVGAHHPIRFSNTYKFYKIGWKGINIDASPGSMEAFNNIRPLDINLEIPVSDVSEKIPFYIINEPALNTFSLKYAEECAKKDIYRIEKTVMIETKTLKSILDNYLPVSQSIDFLSIDAEGFDYRILKSNDWSKYKPKVVLVESDLPIIEFLNSEIHQFMQNQNYEFFAKTLFTAFFKVKNLN